MKKNKIFIIIIGFGILFLSGYLYSTYATSTGVTLGNDDNTYDILLTDSNNTVEIPAKSSKTVYYQFSNMSKGTVKYHIGYSSNNIIAKVWWDSEDPIFGTIEYGEYKFIKLKLINDTTSDDTIAIKPVLGYVNGGDVIPDSNTTLVTGTINETNTMSIKPETALTTLGIDKTAIKEISFVKDNIVPTGALGSTTVSSDNSVMLWYTASDTENMYKIYIGSDNGITCFPSNSTGLFSGFTKMTSIYLSNIDTSNVAIMQSMFQSCSSLHLLDVSNFDTSNVQNMSSMFSGCSSLIELDVTNFNTESVKSMGYMFNNCSSLTNLDVSNFNTSSVTSMFAMFWRCSSLTSLNITNFNTSIVNDMSHMFRDCSNLKNLDLSNFNTLSVTNVVSMFEGCRNLISLDMRNSELVNVNNASFMFAQVPTTANIYLKDTQGNRDFMSNNFSSYTNVQYIPSS